MRVHLYILALVVVVLSLYFNGFFIPKPDRHAKTPDPAAIRAEASAGGLAAIPADWQEAKKLADNPANPVTAAKVELGRRLYFDPILSKDRSISCATCHILQEGGDDNLPTAVGYHGLTNPKHLNSPTVLNAALAKRQFWDGRSPDVEDQAKGPLLAPFEMAITPDEAVSRLRNDPSYAAAFLKVFPNEGVTFQNIARAIAAYERTLLTRGAFDRFMEGDDKALDREALAGLALFLRIGCKGCHNGVAVGGGSLQRFPLRPYNGLLAPESRYVNGRRYFAGFSWQKPKDTPYPFEDLGGFHGKGGMFLFRVPILRNVTRTAPYFHNGTVEKIEEAVRIMARHQLGLTLSKRQISQIVAFLKSLEGEPAGYEVR